MDNRNSFVRPTFSRQSAKCLIFDGSIKFSPSILANLTNSLENQIVLVSNVGGPIRVPYLSISVTTHHTETLLPIQHVRGNYSRIQSAIEELRQILSLTPRTAGEGVLEEALQEVCGQFRRQLKATMQTTGYRCQLEIIIFSCHNCAKLVRQVEKMVNNIDLEYLKRIQVVSMCPDFVGDDIMCSPLSIGSDTSEPMLSASTLSGVVDSLTLDSDPLSIDNYLRGWLHDSASDTEHMHIILPQNAQGEEVVIRCDLSERVLHPNLLPYTTAFSINWTCSGTPSNPRTNPNIPVYKMKVVGLLSNSLLCDSVVYGMPMIAQPTSCWRMEWEELEKNQQSFQVLVSQLHESDQVMVCEVHVPLSVPSKVPYHTQNSTKSDLKGRFVLLPSSNGSLLVKSLAVSELTLPCEKCPPIDCIKEEVKEEISQSLSKVEVLSSYNPLTTTSHLYDTLKSQTKKVQAAKPLRQIPVPPPQQHIVTAASGPTVNRRLFNSNTNKLNKRDSQNQFPTEL